MVTTPLMRKLRLQPGQRILILNAPPGYVESLGTLPEGAELVDQQAKGLDLVHLFVRDGSEVARFGPVAIRAVKHDGLLWISYPKRSSKVETDLTRDVGWDLVVQAGLRSVTQISVDETWSALRFRPVERVGTKASSAT